MAKAKTEEQAALEEDNDVSASDQVRQRARRERRRERARRERASLFRPTHSERTRPAQVDTFADYEPAKVKIGRPHPDPVVETSSMVRPNRSLSVGRVT